MSTVDSANPVAPLTLALRTEHYPFWARQQDEFVLYGVECFASAGTGDLTVYDAETDEPLPPAIGTFTLYLDDNSISELLLAVTWGAP